MSVKKSCESSSEAFLYYSTHPTRKGNPIPIDCATRMLPTKASIMRLSRLLETRPHYKCKLPLACLFALRHWIPPSNETFHYLSNFSIRLLSILVPQLFALSSFFMFHASVSHFQPSNLSLSRSFLLYHEKLFSFISQSANSQYYSFPQCCAQTRVGEKKRFIISLSQNKAGVKVRRSQAKGRQLAVQLVKTPNYLSLSCP